MSNIANKLLKPAFVGMLAASGLLLSGCGTGSGGNGMDSASSSASTSSASTRSVTISGGAVKGVVQNGIVTAWQVSEDSHGHWAIGQQMGSAVRTDSHGQFQLPVSTASTGWVVIELKADGQTTMVCDVTPGCNVSGGSQVPFGQAFSLSSNFELSGAVNLGSTSPQVYLTPLSQLAVSLAQHSAEGLSGSNLQSAYSQVEGWFGLKPGTLQLAPPDLTHLNSATTSTDAIQLAVTNAAFLALVNEPGWTSIEQVLQTATNQVLQNGDLSSTSSTGAVTVDQLEMQTTLLAASLQSTTTDSLAQQALAVTQSRASQLYVSAPTTSGTSTSTSSSTTTTTSSSSSVASASALLQWQAPSTREDGSSLSMAELKGYEIEYGQDPANLNQTMMINDAYTMSATIANLSGGTWYFAVKAVDTSGNVSALSNVVTKTI